MKPEQGLCEGLPEGLLEQVRGGMLPYRPQIPAKYDFSLNPRAMGAAMGAGAVTGGLAGAAVGGLGAGPGAAGGALLGGIGYTTERLLNPTLVRPAIPFAVCHGPGAGAGAGRTPASMMSCHKSR